jgi:exodeoxyribonuclease III
MKIITYNVNGIRAALNKGFAGWLQEINPDVVCLQEVKADLEQIDQTIFNDLGYEIYWHAAEKKGYSGGLDVYDREGRILRADFNQFSLMSAYFPSGSSGEERQAFKMKFLADFQPYISEIKKQKPNLIVSGDYNICHKAIDIHNPKSNAKSSGFLPEEREWMDQFVDLGFVDSFRTLNAEPHHYTWWSLRFGARAKNMGWRIDYQMITEPLKPFLKKTSIIPTAYHSDHCPVLIELEF